ncbi:MAG: hypothetical protein Q8R32_02505, partial [bacterium]|nr:hypothetical protein [bacterium]
PRGLVTVTPEEFAGIHQFLRLLGLRGESVEDGVTLYRVPPWPDETPAAVAVPETGWDTLRGAAVSGLLRVRPGATFSVRVLGNYPVPVTLSFRIHDQKQQKVRLIGPAEPVQATMSPDGTVALFLGTLAPGSHAFSFPVDGSEFFMETPSVRKSLP